ncbi:unnamed protein product [Owenia fusiformis]|uniref:Phospholipase B1, membrane-associated n=1 Tax=Owenia fusiformis TaxID=6347 RepID=A0A8J1U1X7_OWEFU|nr:unnamed protein product [Owenia fusiformis]
MPMYGLVGWMVLILCKIANGQQAYIDDLKRNQMEDMRMLMYQKIQNNATLMNAFKERVKLSSEMPTKSVKFNCPMLKSPVKPTSVHSLRPGDIDIVAAMGDSITAGTGISAKTLPEMLIQYRGQSFSIGGDEDIHKVSTLPNILKYYNQKLLGYSQGDGTVDSYNAHLNLAVPGNEAHDMPGQARDLVDKLRREQGVDYDNDWKMITLFIGGNDLCAVCDDYDTYSATNYINYIQEALDILHAEVPRAFVNMVEVLDVGLLEELNDGLICSALHTVECHCAAFPPSGDGYKRFMEEIEDYQRLTEDLVKGGRYDTKDDFTVVVQPFLKYTKPPRNDDGSPDMSFFAPDCFHFSHKGHAAAAEALWNSMLEPLGLKRTEWRLGEPLECPSEESPYFATSKNRFTNVPKLDRESGNTPTPSLGNGVFVAVTIGTCMTLGVVVLAATVYTIKRRSGRSNEETIGLVRDHRSFTYTT